jgi:hypothetical protein
MECLEKKGTHLFSALTKNKCVPLIEVGND